MEKNATLWIVTFCLVEFRYGISQITNFVVLARRSISTTHRVLVAEERRDQVVQHFKYNHMVFFRHVYEVVVRIIIFNLLEKN